MSDKCLFCGAEIEKQHKGWDRLQCTSLRYNSDGTFETFYSRTPKCYESEIAQLKTRNEKLEDFVRAVKQADENLNCYGDFSKAVVEAIDSLEAPDA